jgi:hypothetical protein
MKVTIEVIPNDKQRYSTVGDWVWTGDDLTIYVSDMGNWHYEMLVAVHELVECLICKERGVLQEDVDEFDRHYEDNRIPGDLSEPGGKPYAPYYKEHQFATCLERFLAVELGIDWNTYNTVVESL